MKRFASLFLLLSVAACGGEAFRDGSAGVAGSSGEPVSPGTAGSAGRPSQSSGGSSAGGATSGAGGLAGSSAAGSAGTFPGDPPDPPAEECIPHDDFQWPPSQGQCDELWVLDVSNPRIEGSLAPGATARLHVDLTEVGGLGWSLYPGVEFTSDHPGVKVGYDTWYYAIFACQTLPASGTLEISPELASGTRVTITARVAMLNGSCPEAASIAVPITIE
jgi:hypothetical protein